MLVPVKDEIRETRLLERQSADDEWLTRAEFIAITKISVDTARRWARRGIGPEAHRVGPRLVRYRADEVRRFLASGRGAA